jgi:uncharacterized protein (DUF1501 family)
VWLNGGPSHVDTFDPKPGGKIAPAKTAVDGIFLSEHLPHLGALMGKLTLVRGLTSREGNHDRARHLLHTGYSPTPTVHSPSLGAWISAELTSSSDLPAFVSIAGPSMGAGFLGVQHGPFVVPTAAEMPRNTGYARNVDMVRFMRRRTVLDGLDDDFAQRSATDQQIKSRREVFRQSVRLMHSDRLRAFNIQEEPEAARTAYGATELGRGLLMARRLVEAGVRYVEITLDGWDTHVDNFTKVKELSGTLDPALAALVRDLDERKLLGSTLVVCMGEFGRTPKLNEREGRDHHPRAFSALLAGAGLRPGIAHGATDSDGTEVASGAVKIPDLFATFADRLGMDPDKELPTPLGRPILLTDHGRPVKELTA